MAAMSIEEPKATTMNSASNLGIWGQMACQWISLGLPYSCQTCQNG